MVGRDIKPVTSAGAGPAPTARRCSRSRICGPRATAAITAVKGVSLTVRAGEIVAVAGVSGNGQRELAEAITGLRPYTTRARSASRASRCAHGDARAAFDAGVGYVPEDRLGTGVAPSLSIAMNLALKSFRDNCRGPVPAARPDARRTPRTRSATFEIKASGPDQQTDYLSGGNLQKVVIAREFSASPSVLVAGSPTRGLDVSAVEQVHSFLLRAAESGTAVLLISEDLDEILALNDRIFVMYEGGLSEMPRGASRRRDRAAHGRPGRSAAPSRVVRSGCRFAPCRP